MDLGRDADNLAQFGRRRLKPHVKQQAGHACNGKHASPAGQGEIELAEHDFVSHNISIDLTSHNIPFTTLNLST